MANYTDKKIYCVHFKKIIKLDDLEMEFWPVRKYRLKGKIIKKIIEQHSEDVFEVTNG